MTQRNGPDLLRKSLASTAGCLLVPGPAPDGGAMARSTSGCLLLSLLSTVVVLVFFLQQGGERSPLHVFVTGGAEGVPVSQQESARNLKRAVERADGLEVTPARPLARSRSSAPARSA